MSQGSLKIGKLMGIDIELHWTFIILMLFPLVFGYLLLFVILLLLFICVLIHELAHSITSLRNGIKVRGIVLLPIGGASLIDSVNIDPKAEFNIAIVGPIMSLLLGSIFGIAVAFSPPGTPTFILQALFELNILLGIFNIIPAFPMDGGRVFRSYLQKRKGKFDATMLAVKVSKYFTALFTVGSLIYLLFINASIAYKEFDFLIYLLIAFFLYGGAQAEKESALLKRDTTGLKIGYALDKAFVMVRPEMTSSELYSIAKKSKSHIMVTKINGRFMLVDFMRKRNAWAGNVSSIAIPIPVVPESSNATDALARVEGNEAGVGIVLRKGRPIGVLTAQRLQAIISLHILSLAGRPMHRRQERQA